jgi:N,N-dimethylformamidase beta subunit-like protein
MKHISRRKALLLGTGAILSGCAHEAFAPSRKDTVRLENTKSGTRDWMLTNTRIDPTTKYRCPWIEGYCSEASARPGDQISFHVSTNPASPFLIEIYRMGFYGGAGGRLVQSLGPFPGKVQPDPPIGPNRLRQCQWEPCHTLRIPNDWPSGVYLGKLTGEREDLQSYVIFIVRDDRRADFIFQCSDTTWHAYNRWPSQFSLYDDGKKVWYWGPDVDISFDRPYGKYCQILDAPLSTGSGEWFLWEFPLAYWMESLGYDVTYISNLDLHRDPKSLRRAKGFLSVGHDEYYSIEMFKNLKGAINDGLNVAFLSGNSVCGRIEFKGPRDRIFTRADRFGPPDPKEIKDFPEMERFPWSSPNENTLMGARSVFPVTGGADWTCVRPDHWIFAGTGMKKGDGIPGLVGWEWHGDPANIPGLEVVATGITKSGRGEGVFTATIYPGPKKNFVFNASSCWWADGISEPPGYVRPSAYTTPKGPDPRAQQITRNILERMRSS